MNADDVRTAFLGLPPESKLLVTARLAHNLTIAARSDYPGQGADHLIGPRLRTWNELLHTVSAKLMHEAAGDAAAFPDGGFLDVLFEKAGQGQCERALVDAFRWSLPPAPTNNERSAPLKTA